MIDGKPAATRHPGRDLVPVGRRQDHARAPPGRAGAARVLGLVHDARRPRRARRDGVDYKFVTEDEFSSMVERNEFAEWAVVHGNRYGTAVHTVNRALEDGKDYLFDVDYQGGAQIRRQWPDESVLVFILPPSMAELERRLRRRATDAPEAIERRLATAKRELEHFARVRLPGRQRQPGDGAARSCPASTWRPAARAPAASTRARAAGRSDDRGTGGRRPRRNERRSGDLSPPFGRTTPPPTSVSSSAASPSPPNATPARSGARAIRTSSTRSAWPASSPSCASTCRRSARACCTTASRTPARPPRTSSELFGTEIAVPGRRRHQARQDHLDHARGAAGRELPQDAARDGARHPRHPGQARRSRRQHADARAHAAREAGAHRARDAARSTRRSRTASASSG